MTDEEFKEKERIRKRIYRQNNREAINQRTREKYHNNPDFKKYEIDRAKEYRDNNIDKARKRENNYKRLNRDKVNLYAKEKYKNDINFKLSQVLRGKISKKIKNKSNSSFELLGTDIDTVLKHLESKFLEGMTWENYGYDGWHIDHIIPCASFDLTDPEEQKKCFHYTNLQPLWGKDNLMKGKKTI